jgi:hypothetical protein
MGVMIGMIAAITDSKVTAADATVESDIIFV